MPEHLNTQLYSQVGVFCIQTIHNNTVSGHGSVAKDFRASGLGQVRRLTAATAAITIAYFTLVVCLVLESACTE